MRKNLVAFAGVALLAGCGAPYSEESPERVSEDVLSAVEGWSSVHLVLKLGIPGSKPLTMDLRADRAGNCEGTVVSEDGTLEMLGVGGRVWTRAGADYWAAAASDDELGINDEVAGHWVEAKHDLTRGMCDLDNVLDGPAGARFKSLEVGKATTVGGLDAVAISVVTEQGWEATGHVRADEPHHLTDLRLADGAFSVSFSEFDVPVDAEEPDAEDVVDVQALIKQ